MEGKKCKHKKWKEKTYEENVLVCIVENIEKQVGTSVLMFIVISQTYINAYMIILIKAVSIDWNYWNKGRIKQ